MAGGGGQRASTRLVEVARLERLLDGEGQLQRIRRRRARGARRPPAIAPAVGRASTPGTDSRTARARSSAAAAAGSSAATAARRATRSRPAAGGARATRPARAPVAPRRRRRPGGPRARGSAASRSSVVGRLRAGGPTAARTSARPAARRRRPVPGRGRARVGGEGFVGPAQPGQDAAEPDVAAGRGPARAGPPRDRRRRRRRGAAQGSDVAAPERVLVLLVAAARSCRPIPPRTSTSSAFWTCSRFSDWSQIRLRGPSMTAEVISSPRWAGRQCIARASGPAASSSASSTWKPANASRRSSVSASWPIDVQASV